MDARPGEETLDISGPSSLSHLGPPASSCHCLSRVQTIVGKQGRNRAVHPTSRWVDVGHWDRSERLQKKRPATKQHHWIPGRKFSLDDSRIAGQDNVTIISPTSDHSGPACIGPGSELPASVAVPCGRKRRGPDRPLSANSPHGRPITKETQDKQSSLPVQHRHPLHPSRPSSLNHCRQRGRPSPNGMWGALPSPYTLYSALPTSTPPTAVGTTSQKRTPTASGSSGGSTASFRHQSTFEAPQQIFESN